jgi:Fe-S oxidoreductase
MSLVFAPGCALMIYKPHLAVKMSGFLKAAHGAAVEHYLCCRHEPGLALGTRIVNVCPGCDRRFRELYPGITTISAWQILAADDSFPFPDYGGAAMSILDACPTRNEDRVHEAIRTLLLRMNIRVVEPRQTRTNGICCGDSLYGEIPVEDVMDWMRRRAADMPAEDVVVYCVSCVKAMHIGGKKPRYLVDLLFGESTEAGTFHPDAWHAELQAYIDRH